MNKKFWNFIRNETSEDSPESVELRISGDIVPDNDAWIYEWLGEESASPNAFREELNNYKDKDITVWIDSYGGDVFAAAGIYNVLKNHNGKITVKIDSKAMSAASVIAMAGDEILMSPVGVMMIHNPLTGVKGDMRDLRKAAEVLDTVKETIVNAYISKTRKSKSKISAMMDDETWMSANVAVKQGFADSILYQDESIENVADFAFNRFEIQNSANECMKKLINFEKTHNKKLQNKISEKEKLLMELDLI